MPFQAGKNVGVYYKVEGAFTTPPGTGGGKQLRLNASPGTDLERDEIKNPEIRSDGLTSLSRLGSRRAPGSYGGPLAVGAWDDILEAIVRNTWQVSFSVTSTGAGVFIDVTANATNQITRTGSGSWLTDGFRVGDVVRLTTYSTAADNSINLRIKALSATVMTFHGTPLTIGAADTTTTVTCLKKLKNGLVPTKRTFYVEEVYQDIDGSEVFGGCKWVEFKITGDPKGIATIDVRLLGATGQTLTGAGSPYYISPTTNTNIALVFVDALISVAGTDIANATSFELTYTIAAQTQDIIGGTTSPDVFDNDAMLTGQFTVARQDLNNVTAYIAETAFELHVLLVEPEAEPKDCIAIYVPNCLRTKASAPLGGDGAMIETIPFTCGKKEGFAATGYDDTLITFSTSAP